jgi:pimeloyl-CoA synthetase
MTKEIKIDKKIYKISVSKRSFVSLAASNNLSLKIEFIQLTQEHIDAKRVDQASERIGDILFDIVSGPTQQEGIDYTVGANFIDWADMELEQILNVDDVVRLAYLVEVI